MKNLNGYRIKWMLVGVVAAVVLGGGSAKSDIIMSEATCVDQVINNGTNTQECSFLQDGLKLYFSNNLPGGYGGHDLWVSTRETQDAPWQEPVNLGPNVNGPKAETYPAISPDELEIYFHYGISDPSLWRSTRASKDEPWGPVARFTGLGVPACDLDISADGLTVYFDSDRSGGYGDCDIWMATRETVSAPWGEAVNLGPNVNNSGWQGQPSISNDGLALFYNNGDLHGISVSTRPRKDAPWSPPVLLGPAVNGGNWQHGAEISPDGSVLYFDSGRPGGYSGENFWQVKFIPIVDFNCDGIVNAEDMCIMIDHWGESYSLCDIGPTPWGDGIVDVQDLIVLSEHLFEEILSPGLIAYWKLDEIDGDTAHDSVGDNNGTLSGNPTWQSEGGQVGGALQFDGINDYVSTPFILNPGFTEFSVFAWIQGGSPGQVIISQKNGFGNVGATWLGADTSDGKLITDLTSPTDGSLESESVITDGQWHHIGFVWDGSYRQLYVDGAQVAKDTVTLTGLKSSTGSMYIGVGKDRTPDSFFSGLIDDVRIYDVTLTAEQIAALAK
jgi:Tol biopolymer transport system component